MFGLAVHRLAPGGFAVIDDRADSYPVAPSRLPAGKYRAAAAVFDRHRQDSQWRREPGNLYSKTVAFALGGAGHPKTIVLELSETAVPRSAQAHDRVEIVEIKSKLLSGFRHEDVLLRAGVILPIDRNKQRRYPAVYSIPGFGGNRARKTHHAGGRVGCYTHMMWTKLLVMGRPTTGLNPYVECVGAGADCALPGSAVVLATKYYFYTDAGNVFREVKKKGASRTDADPADATCPRTDTSRLPTTRSTPES